MDNMQIYNAVRKVPDEAKKTIGAGRLKGMTDINPMWRIEKLTEQFGPVGLGWYYTIDKQWTIESPETHEVAAFCNITLHVKFGDEWSAPIPGTGGAAWVASERNGLHASDECFKMALTDAISVACKALGVGADVYYAAGRSKYSDPGDEPWDGKPKEQREAMKLEAAMKYVPVGEDQSLGEILKAHGMKALKAIYDAGDAECKAAVEIVVKEAQKRKAKAGENKSE